MLYPSDSKDADRMMDDIAGAQSAPELVWLRSEVARRFASDSRRAMLERFVDEMLLVVTAAARRSRPDGPGSSTATDGE